MSFHYVCRTAAEQDQCAFTEFIPEKCLPAAMVGGILLAISLFMFWWTGASSIPWILPVFAIGVFTSSIFLLIQAALKYVNYSVSGDAGVLMML